MCIVWHVLVTTRAGKEFYSARRASLSIGAPHFAHGLTGTPQALNVLRTSALRFTSPKHYQIDTRLAGAT